MRDHGYDFWYYDSYCQNLFAEDFAVQADERRSFELLTSFEVFEHMVDPMRDLDEMLRFSKRVIFTTELLPEPMPSMGQWWYHGPDHGQHVGFFSIRTLEWVAKKHSLCFATNGKNFHYLGKAAINGRVFRFLTHARAESLLRLCRRPSLLMTDLDIRRAKSFARVGYNAKPPSVAGN
jgi:hypothetical protein